MKLGKKDGREVYISTEVLFETSEYSLCGVIPDVLSGFWGGFGGIFITIR